MSWRIAGVVTLQLAACSIAVEGPPARLTTPQANAAPLDCTTSYALPIIDLSFAAGFVGGSLAAFGRQAQLYGGTDNNGGGMWSMVGSFLLIPAAIDVFASAIGVSKVHACRTAGATP